MLSADVLIDKNNILSLKRIFSKYSNVGIVSPFFFLNDDSQVNYSSFPIKESSSEIKSSISLRSFFVGLPVPLAL